SVRDGAEGDQRSSGNLARRGRWGLEWQPDRPGVGRLDGWITLETGARGVWRDLLLDRRGRAIRRRDRDQPTGRRARAGNLPRPHRSLLAAVGTQRREQSRRDPDRGWA